MGRERLRIAESGVAESGVIAVELQAEVNGEQSVQKQPSEQA
jgi:hypothetical protein